MNYHFLQSKKWEEFQISQGKETIREKTENYEFLALIEKTKIGNYLYLPYGPLLNEDHPKKALKDALKSLRSLAKEKSAFFIRIEPTTRFTASEMAKNGLKKTKDLNPKETWAIDLKNQTEEEILSHIEKTKTKLYRNHSKKNLEISISNNPKDIDFLYKFLEKVSEKDHFNIYDKNYLKSQLKTDFAKLYLISLNKKPIAASLCYDDNKTRYFVHAAANPEFRSYRASAIMRVQQLLDAKQEGFETADFWGIAPKDAPKTHPWAGFTAYKKSFGGYEKDYSGTYDLPINKPKYLIYTILRKLNRIRRKK